MNKQQTSLSRAFKNYPKCCAITGSLTALILVSSQSLLADSTPPAGEKLLQSRFGVTLTLDPTFNTAAGYDDNTGSGVTGGYMFDHTSFVPTKNVATVDWTEGDWFGSWGPGFAESTIQHTPAPGTPDNDYYSSGGEWYDVEALYIDNDDDYVYLAVVTSVPFAVTDLDADEDVDDVGVFDPRIAAGRAFIRPGDVSISLFKPGTARNENNSTTWNYNYGLDITDDIRPNNDQSNEDQVGSLTTSFMRSFDLGTGFYETTSDLPATAADIIYPTTGDWYTGSRVGHVVANYEHTSFDPNHPQSTATLLGNATYVDYYEYNFPSGNEENNAATYIIEAIIPRALFGASNPTAGDLIGLRWVEGCRNDGDALAPVLSVTGDIDKVEIGNLVWEDLNGDGDRDSGEPGIGGVEVCLQDASGDPVLVEGPASSSHADTIVGYTLDGNVSSWSGGGTGSWPTDGAWLDSQTGVTEDGTNEGRVRIENFSGDQMITLRNAADVARAVDLSGCGSAVLTFDYERYNAAWLSTDQLFFEYSEDGGSSWSTLKFVDGDGLDGSAQSSGNLLLPNTANRFRVRSDADDDTKRVRLNNFNVDCTSLIPLTATTDASGFYYFGNAEGLEASTAYQVCVDTTQSALNGLVLTVTNAGGVTSNDPLGDDLDSDASPSGNEAVIALTSPADDTNYSYDFGFTCPVLTVGPSSLAAGEVGELYSQTLTTTGGTGPYTYTLTSGSLPAGLSLNGDKIEGTPTAVESQTFTITSTDDIGCVGIATFSVSISCDPLSISPGSLADAQFGQSYGPVNFSAPDANGAVTWTLSSGSLPAGMSFVDSGNIGVLSGTPTEAGAFNFAITAADTAGCVGSANLSLNIPIASITGTTFEDTDNDDDGDVAINVTTIRLCASDGVTAIDNPNVAGTQDYVITTTDGSYAFVNLAPGDYIVKQDQPNGFLTVTDGDTTNSSDDAANGSTTDNSIPVSVVGGETDDGNNFVEEQIASISGTTFEDTDNDDDGDVAINVTTIRLCASDGVTAIDNPNVAGTQDYVITTTDGTYAFTGLAPGDYIVKQDQPSGFLTVTDGDTTSPGDDAANGSTTDNSIPVSVLGGESDTGNDFVEEQIASISGTTFEDTDNDDAGDVVINATTIRLCAADGTTAIDNPNIAGTQDYVITTTDGTYAFTGLAPGDYIVKQDQPSGFLTVTDGDTTNPSDDAANGSTTDNSIPVSVVGGETDSGNDFVEEQPAAIAGTIYEDTDGDGNGDVVINVVTLTLCTDLNGDGDSDDAGEGAADNPNLAGTQDYIITTTDGTYAFTGLTPGSYVVKETQPNGYLTVTDLDSAADTGTTADPSNASTSDNLIPATVDAGETDSGNDFVEEVPVAVGNLVFSDLNDNGVYDAGEGVDGINVQIFSAGGDDQIGGGDDVEVNVGPDGILGTADDAAGGMVTVSGGCYLFSNLPSGKYYILIPSSEFTTGGGLVGHLPLIGQGGDIASDDNADENGDDVISDGVTSTVIDLANNAEPTKEAGKDEANAVNAADDDNTNLTVDFGFVESASIAGTIYEDVNGDGNGDVVINVVTLTLCTDLNGDGDSDDAGEGPADNPNLAGTQDYIITTTDGTYAFTGLTPGSYVVKESQPSNFVTVSDLDSTPDTGTTADQSNISTSDDRIPVTLDAGETDSGNDFVEIRKSDTYGAYLASYGSTLNGETALGDNPDGDIYPNALEYAFCLNAANGVPGHGEFSLEKEADGTVTAQFMRRRGGLSDVTYTLEGAATLATPTVWSNLGVVPSINTTDSDVPLEAEKVVYSNLQNVAPATPASGVVRLKVEVDADGSGTITPDEVFYTRIYGWQCNSFNDYECATFSAPFSEKPVFSGTFGSTPLTLSTDGDGNVTFDLSDSAYGEDLSALVGSNGEYYLQITSGTFEGHRFDILGGGVDSLTLTNDDDIFEETIPTLNTLDGLPTDAALAGASYQIIRYRTIDDVYTKDNAFAGQEDNTPSDATRILFYDVRKSNPGFDTVMLVGTAPNTKWIRVTDPFAQVDQGGRRLDPAYGTWVHPKSSGDSQNPAGVPPVTMFTSGMVASHDQAAPMNEGFNLMAAMWPLDQTPAGPNGRNLTLAEGFDGGSSPTKSTELLFWKGDQVVDDVNVTDYETGYEAYMLANAGPFNYWLDRADSTLTNQDELLILESHRAVMHKLLTNDEKKPHLYPVPNF